MATIGAGRLKQLRTTHRLSQRALAQAAGISRQAVGAIESGRTQPSVGIALALAGALGTTVEELFGAAPPQQRAARVAVAAIGGREVAYRLERDHLAIEPAQSSAQAVFIGGCDLAIGVLSRLVSLRSPDLRALWLPMTNRAAMSAVGRDRLHAAVIHDAADAILVDARFARYAVAGTIEGWLVASGNPLKFRGALDLGRRRVRLANRPVGAGARGLLDAELRRAGIDAASVTGYACQLAGQLDVGRAIAQGFADVAVGTAGVAQAYGLDFIGLRDERLMLVIPRSRLKAPVNQALLVALTSAAYRRELEALATYDVAATGTEVA